MHHNLQLRLAFNLGIISLNFLLFDSIHPTRLAVFFRNNQVETIKRMEKSSYSDFLAICGSLLGLFLGISTLSIIEFIYYASLRWYCANRREELDAAKEAAIATTDVVITTTDGQINVIPVTNHI